MCAKMIIDEAHTVGSAAPYASVIEVDAMGQKNGSSHSGTIVGNLEAVAFDCFCSDQIGRRANDGLLTAVRVCSAATSGKGSYRGTYALGRGRGTSRHHPDKDEGAEHTEQGRHTHVSIPGPQNRETRGNSGGIRHRRWKRLD